MEQKENILDQVFFFNILSKKKRTLLTKDSDLSHNTTEYCL